VGGGEVLEAVEARGTGGVKTLDKVERQLEEI
jgi:hypothetical protein